jgi:hypothetical protein
MKERKKKNNRKREGMKSRNYKMMKKEEIKKE